MKKIKKLNLNDAALLNAVQMQQVKGGDNTGTGASQTIHF